MNFFRFLVDTNEKILLLFVMALYVSSCTQDLTKMRTCSLNQMKRQHRLSQESYILTLLMIYPPRFLR